MNALGLLRSIFNETRAFFMKKKRLVRDFDFYIDEYMYNCRSRKLRPKTMQSYEQTLRLFERWCLEEAGITEPGQVLDSTIRHYICSLQERGKYTLSRILGHSSVTVTERAYLDLTDRDLRHRYQNFSPIENMR